MRKYSEIEEAREDGYVPSDEKVLLIRELIKEGHKPISINRALAIVEQCEADDEFPPGWCAEPLRITIYPDPTLDDLPVRIYLHAGRHGLMETISERGGRRMIYIPIDFEEYQKLHTIDGSGVPDALLKLMIVYLQPGYRKRVFNDSLGAEMYPFQADEVLERSATEAMEAMTRYVQRLKDLAS